VERKSGMALLAKVPFKRADLVAQAIEERLKPYTSVAKTLTLDNGKEFSHHQQIGVQNPYEVFHASLKRVTGRT
jgi:transposase, IS30 family